MEIKDNRGIEKEKSFYELERGEVFEDKDGIYMKFTEIYALDLMKNKIIGFPSHIVVKVLHAKIVIED